MNGHGSNERPEPTDAVASAFLDGHGIAVAPGKVEEVLAQLWGSAADAEPGSATASPAVTRLVLSNLVVADLAARAPRIDESLETLARRYPSRIILLRPALRDDRAVTAEVSALCHLPAPGQPQVCSERIVLRAPPAAFDLLPGAIRPLLVAEIPLVLWWCCNPVSVDRCFRTLAAESSRLLIDLADPGTPASELHRALDLELNPFNRDLAWFGATLWRELLAQFFDPPGSARSLAALREVRIEAVAHDGSGPGPARVALWLAAWLAGQLDWSPRTCRSVSPGNVSAVFQAPDGPVTFKILTSPAPGVEQAQITAVLADAGSLGTFRLRRKPGSGEVTLVTDAPGHDPLPRVQHAPEWDRNRRLAAALESARDDPPYRKALPGTLWMLEQAAEPLTPAQNNTGGT